MKRSNKGLHLSNIENILSMFRFLILANFRSISAKDLFSLRRELKLSGSGIMVVKNSLAKIAINKNDDFQCLNNMFNGPILLIYSADIVNVSKVIASFIKQNKNKITLICAYNNKSIMSPEDILYLAKLPSLDEARVQLMRLISYNIIAKLDCYLKLVAKSKEAN